MLLKVGWYLSSLTIASSHVLIILNAARDLLQQRSCARVKWLPVTFRFTYPRAGQRGGRVGLIYAAASGTDRHDRG